MGSDVDQHRVGVSAEVKDMLEEYKRLTGIPMSHVANDLIKDELSRRLARRRELQVDIEDLIREKQAKNGRASR